MIIFFEWKFPSTEGWEGKNCVSSRSTTAPLKLKIVCLILVYKYIVICNYTSYLKQKKTENWLQVNSGRTEFTGRVVNKHTLIWIILSGQYFSTSASNSSTGLQLCLWREKVQMISVVMNCVMLSILKKRFLFHLPFLERCFKLQTQ